jgi:hypothetical protein
MALNTGLEAVRKIAKEKAAEELHSLVERIAAKNIKDSCSFSF